MRSTPVTVLCCLALAALLPAQARGQASGTEARLREALRTTSGQLRALEAERAAWQAREAELDGKLQSLRAELAAARRAPAKAKAKADESAALDARIAEQTEANAKLSQALAQCEAASREVAEAARAQESERARLSGETSSLAERLAAAERKNQRMYRVGKDVIDWLSQKGIGRAITSREPFLGLKRVELENIAQDYEDKLLEEKLNP